MKAILFKGNQHPWQLTELPAPQPEKGQVLVRLSYASLNHLDLLISKKVSEVPLPGVIPGSDGAGTIAAVGEGVTRWKKGQEVIINPGLNWGTDLKAHSPQFDILGFPDNGTFAEYIIISQDQIFPKPIHLSFAEAAALPMAALTAYRVLFTRGNLQKGQNVLVTGAGGGVAQFLLQFAIAAGANVYVTSGNDTKISFALKQGAKKGFNYNHKEWVSQAKEEVKDGFDLIVDSAGGEGFLDLIDLIRVGGTIVIFGRTAGNIPSIFPGLLYNKQINILASIMGSPIEFAKMLEFYTDKQLHPVIDKIYSLPDFEAARERMEKGQQIGKILFSIND